MANKLTKRLFVFVTIATIALVVPGIALAVPSQLDTTPTAILAQATAETNLTPQRRQQLQAVRQRRNKEIAAVLTSSQRVKLARSLRSGDHLNQALENLQLQPDQQELIDTIIHLYDLKMKAVLSRYSLPVGQK